jgi:hypothetical protein
MASVSHVSQSEPYPQPNKGKFALDHVVEYEKRDKKK